MKTKAMSLERATKEHVKRVLGKRIRHFTDPEIEGLLHIFIEAGEMAVLAHVGSPVETAESMEYSRNLLRTARTQQAATTPTGSPDRILPQEWQKADQIGRDNAHWLLRMPGVIGMGPAYKIKNGNVSGDVCLAIYVAEKLPNYLLKNRLSIPSLLYGQNIGPIRTDVVALGSFSEMSSVMIGDSIGPNNLRKRGTIGALATDLSSNQPVAITAMHVTGLKRDYPEDYVNSPSIQFSAPSQEYHDHELLGYLITGRSRHTDSGVDASSISIENNRQSDFYHPRIGKINGWRPISSSDLYLPVQMFGDTSKYQTGKIIVPTTSLTHIGLESVILVDILTNDGDSGAALVDNDGFVLGILSGRINATDLYFDTMGIRDLAVFCTIGYVLQELYCDII
ncbi:hypothetical protein ACFS7Z_13885 [Pontibacter toksunensis]|uniref:Uncharacterized protein n=1 Tax=Pontibacter toksunensis TaxID=1332631 RepID=A0ABW6BZI3_9BACT